MPSITPGENPCADISTCAWNIAPSIGEPGVPGWTNGGDASALTMDACASARPGPPTINPATKMLFKIDATIALLNPFPSHNDKQAGELRRMQFKASHAAWA